jgi:hypothetical protein
MVFGHVRETHEIRRLTLTLTLTPTLTLTLTLTQISTVGTVPNQERVRPANRLEMACRRVIFLSFFLSTGIFLSLYFSYRYISFFLIGVFLYFYLSHRYNSFFLIFLSIMLVSKSRTEFGPARLATVEYFSTSVIFGSNQVDEMRCLGNLWLQECERWRALTQHWNVETQDALVFGQEAVHRRRGNRIVGAFLSIDGDKVEVSVRKTMLPLEELGEDLLALS